MKDLELSFTDDHPIVNTNPMFLIKYANLMYNHILSRSTILNQFFEGVLAIRSLDVLKKLSVFEFELALRFFFLIYH